MGCPHLASRPLLTRTTALLHRFSTPALKHRTHPVSLRPTVILSRAMSHKPQIIETEQFSTPAKWLRLERIKWRDQEGKERFWEVANRSTRSKGGVDSCHILALVHHSAGKSVVLIEQYRPPAGATVIEFPAGLIDEGEDAATTALRELHEETGYTGAGVTVRSVSPVLVKDPGMTGANMNLVTVDIRLPPDAPEPVPKLEEGEHIVKRLVPLTQLSQVLREYADKGFAIDALVASVAVGLTLA